MLSQIRSVALNLVLASNIEAKYKSTLSPVLSPFHVATPQKKTQSAQSVSQFRPSAASQTLYTLLRNIGCLELELQLELEPMMMTPHIDRDRVSASLTTNSACAATSFVNPLREAARHVNTRPLSPLGGAAQLRTHCHALSKRPLTLCNCDCKILTAAISSGLRRCSVEQPHPGKTNVPFAGAIC